ncbi:LysR family transcriptional regulator [Primorskyibacter flagellatus]|uniref:DNA-binding transcriptional regulator, LysR family n=1 Tax=Primorskyibacter flagellatus TaxID=1387277 RepID=A0A1W1ZAD7_9RHOB|nr:LysR family transcriptional regulator [Primorskyibacter flagellatus]SMC45276.1 DNA-binding transcriptional regulator, LysR family [Primorskyibacter flagellatus]
MDRLLNLRAFVRVADTLNFSEAAASLQIARSSVSKLIQDLEDELGTRLIQRSTRQVSLTPDGHAFRERCIALICEAESMQQMFARDGPAPRGALRVSLPSRIAHHIVAPALPDFFARYPDIELDLVSTDRPVDLLGEGFDCVVRVGRQKDSNLMSRKIGELEMLNCASPAYLQRYGVPQTVDDLHRHITVGYSSRRASRDQPWTIVENGVESSIRMKCLVSVNSAELFIACCKAGMGLIQIPAYDVQLMLQDGSLVEVMSDQRTAAMPIAVVSPERPSASPMISAFADWLSTLMDEYMAERFAGPSRT